MPWSDLCTHLGPAPPHVSRIAEGWLCWGTLEPIKFPAARAIGFRGEQGVQANAQLGRAQ